MKSYLVSLPVALPMIFALSIISASANPANGIPGQPYPGPRPTSPVPHPTSGPTPPMKPCLPSTPPADLAVQNSSLVNNQTLFATIKAALDYAKLHRACGVRVTIDSGTYPELLNISMSTTLIGRAGTRPVVSGAILNRDGYPLSVENLSISKATAYGIDQTGGTLNLKDVYIGQVRANPNVIATGIGIRLTGGAHATLDHVNMYSNGATALYLSGAQTQAKATHLSILDNKAHPLALTTTMTGNTAALDSLATIDVTDGALLLIEDSGIANSEYLGLLARKNGRAHFRNGTIVDTKSIKDPKVPNQNWGGLNVMAKENGIIELHDFVTSGAATCGLAAYRGFLKAANGQVRQNSIGLCGNAPESDYDVTKCVGGETVHYTDNGTDLWLDGYIPLPCSPNDSSCSQQANCPGVPWQL